jgi:hypothetical protein
MVLVGRRVKENLYNKLKDREPVVCHSVSQSVRRGSPQEREAFSGPVVKWAGNKGNLLNVILNQQ